MSGTAKAIHRAPADQPTSVHELTERLFSAYTVEGGVVHLAGCRLEDRLFVQSETRIMDESGQAVEEDLVRTLGMDETVPWQRPPEMAPDCLDEAVRRSTECVRQRWDVSGELDAHFIWCKYADGKLRFTIGDQSVDLPFSGWTRTLVAPPFVCPYSGKESYHVVATDDGRLTAAENIRTCAETGRRVLADDLVNCDATGEAVMPDQTQTCPVTERPVLERAMMACSMCSQRVSPKALADGKCLACRSMRFIAKDESPLASVLSQYPKLNRWPKWEFSETTQAYIFVAGGWWKRLLLVISKADLQVQHSATGRRFGGRFSTVDLDARPEFLA